MKKCSSLVWRFFDRVANESNRCVAVLCKLCDTQYKFFGNTTNLRVHLTNKHPLQWELAQNGTLDETNFRTDAEETNQSTPAAPKRKKYSRAYKDKNVRYSVSVDNQRDSTGMETIPKIEIQRIDVLENSDVENDQREDEEATFNLVRHLHDSSGLRGSDEEWLEEEVYTTYEPKRKKIPYRNIKREPTTPPKRSPYLRPVKYEKPAQSPIVIENSFKDEFSVFAEYVANKLRKFKEPKTRGNLQQLITTILWQAEYGAYDSADAVKRLLMYSVHETVQSEQTVIQQAPDFIQSNVQSEEIVEHTDEDQNQSIETDA